MPTKTDTTLHDVTTVGLPDGTTVVLKVNIVATQRVWVATTLVPFCKGRDPSFVVGTGNSPLMAFYHLGDSLRTSTHVMRALNPVGDEMADLVYATSQHCMWPDADTSATLKRIR